MTDDRPVAVRQCMGTEFCVYSAARRRLVERAAEDALDRVEWIERALSHRERDSDISMLNRQAGGGAVRVTDAVFALLLRCQELYLLTEGAFDPALGGTFRDLGLERSGAAGMVAERRRRADAAAGGWAGVHLDSSSMTVTLDAPGVRLNLAGIGKGWAVDAAQAWIRQCGVESACTVAGGSSMAAYGAGPLGGRWAASVRNPWDAQQQPAIVPFGGLAMATSAHRTRAGSGSDGVRHIIDPRTGTLARRAAQVSIIAGDATAAEALSTAACVRGLRWTTRLVRDGTAVGAVVHTPAGRVTLGDRIEAPARRSS